MNEHQMNENETDKPELRKKMLSLRDAVPENEKYLLDNRIIEHLFGWDTFQKARSLFCYVSFRSEVNTTSVLEQVLSSGRTLLVPKIDPETHTMSAVRIGSLQELLPGFYGIPEPAKNDPYSGNMDLVVAPGCAFTEKGDRLGYGGGYYDRFLEHLDRSLTTVCSLTYQRFVLPNLPVKKTDIPVDYLITQEGIHDCRKMRG